MEFKNMLAVIRETYLSIKDNLTKDIIEKDIREKITLNQYLSMMYIYRNENVTSKMLVEHLKITKPSVSILLDKLVEFGLVNKTKSDEDKRISFLSLTEKGREFVSKEDEAYIILGNEMKKSLSEEEFQLFLNLYKKVINGLIKK